MSVGSELARARGVRGLSLGQVAAATRIRAEHLAALEDDRYDDLPGPTYARGYLRAYAGHLGLDAGPLLAGLGPAAGGPRRGLSIGSVAPALDRRLALTGPTLATAGLVLLAALFVAYVWRELESARDGSPPPAAVAAVSAPVAIASSAPELAPSPVPAPAPRPVTVVISATQLAWLYVEVDGKPYFGASGRMLDAGQSTTVIGTRVKVTSGKPPFTLVSVDGADPAPLGVATKEFAAQN